MVDFEIFDENTKDEVLLRQFDTMFEELTSDVSRIALQYKLTPTPVWRRAFFRAVFAMMEGLNNWLKWYVVEIYWPCTIGDKTKQKLLDKRVVVDKSGNSRIVPAFKEFTDNFFFAFDTFAWTSGSNFCPDKTSEEWTLLKQAKEIRNRIVHPKRPDDLKITEAEFFILLRISDWYIAILMHLFRSVAKALFEEAESMKQASRKHFPDQAHLIDIEDEELNKKIRALLAEEEDWPTKTSTIPKS